MSDRQLKPNSHCPTRRDKTVGSARVGAVRTESATHTHTHTHPFNCPLSRTTQVSRYQKGETNLDFTEARDSEWQWHQLGHMQVGTSLQTDNHASTSKFLQAGCPSCRPTNTVKSLKAKSRRQSEQFVICPIILYWLHNWNLGRLAGSGRVAGSPPSILNIADRRLRPRVLPPAELL